MMNLFGITNRRKNFFVSLTSSFLNTIIYLHANFRNIENKMGMPILRFFLCKKRNETLAVTAFVRDRI
jgi:hypothetical protein